MVQPTGFPTPPTTSFILSLQPFYSATVPYSDRGRIKDIIIKDKVMELAKLRKMFMLSVDTRGQEHSRVVKGRRTPGQLLTPHNGNAHPSHSKLPHLQGTVFAAFVAKNEQLVHSKDTPSSVP